MPFQDATMLLEDMRRTTGWTCDECGAVVVDVAGSAEFRMRHEAWHGGVNRSINEASPDFAGC